MGLSLDELNDLIYNERTGDRIFEAPCLRFAEQYSMHTPTYLYKLRGGVHAIIDALQCGIMCVPLWLFFLFPCPDDLA